VLDAPLEVLNTESLPPGDYLLRLTLYGNGTSLGEPHVIPFRVDPSLAAQNAGPAGSGPLSADLNVNPNNGAPGDDQDNGCIALSGCP
jgi:hypothetical protein